MNGAESLVRTLLASGVDTCFANPGTSEMHFVDALDKVPGMRAVLALFEGVATGAADGYWRMADRPAATLLHLGPGLANGVANLHNARKAGSGIVNVVGEHATWHLAYDAPLKSDLDGIARPVSDWQRTAPDSRSVGAVAAQAVAVARGGKIASLILPGDAAWDPAEGAAPPVAVAGPVAPAGLDAAVEAAARALRGGEPVMLILGGRALRGAALERAGQIAGRTGARLATQFFSARVERGAGRVPALRIPYFVEAALPVLAPYRHMILVETGEPLAFFAYPDKPSLLKAEGTVLHHLCPPGGDGLAALDALAQAVGARPGDAPRQARGDGALPQGALTPASIAGVLAAMIPEGAIVVDESLTTGRESIALTAGARPHDWLQNMGGSIGFGPPVATGAALACPDRPVLALIGDGSAMYTIQALWTQAREGLNVTTLIFANRTYQILLKEFEGVGAGKAPGPSARRVMSLDEPVLDFVALARGMGVPATRAESAEALTAQLGAALASPGPALIEVVL